MNWSLDLDISKNQGKKTVVIERPKARLANKGIFNKSSQQTNNFKRESVFRELQET